MMNLNRCFPLLKLMLFVVMYQVLNVEAGMPEYRIISTDASVTDLLFEFGMQDHLVAVDVTSQLPKGFKALPNVGYHRNLSAEGLLSLTPSIVIGSDLMGPDNVTQALTAAQVPFLQLPIAKTIVSLKSNINKVALQLQAQTDSKVLTQWIDEQVGLLKKRPLKEERIAFLLSMNPSKLRLAGKGTNGDALITLLGAKNIGHFDNYRNVSAESLLAMNPTIILVAGSSPSTAVKSLLDAQSILKYSEAAKAGKIKGIDGRSLVAGLSIAALKEALRISKNINDPIETP